MAITLTVGDVIELEDGSGSIHTEDGLGVLETEAAATDLSNYILYGSMSLKVNTFDFALIDPSFTPPINAPLTMTNPTWTGTVASATSSDPVERSSGHKVITCTATNTVQATASAAPFNLSDNPSASYALQTEAGATIDLEDGSGTIDSEDLAYPYRKLAVKKTQNSDGSTTQSGTCEVEQTGLWPLQTFTLTSANQGYSAANFSVQDVSVTWNGLQHAIYSVTFGDPIVTMSVWVNSTAAGILPITTTKITDSAVTTPKIAAGSITADKLTATLILASMIQSGAGPAHTEMDANGFRAYDASGNLVINIPTNGSPVTVSAALVASSLVATGNAVFNGAGNELALGSLLKLDGSQGNPVQAPSLAQGWDSVTFPVNSTYDYSSSQYKRVGLHYDSAGGAGGATKVFWTVTNKGSGHDYALELLASDRTVNRTIDLGTGITPAGVCRLGSYIYILYWTGSEYRVGRYLQGTLAFDVSTAPVLPVSPATTPQICADGTNIYIVDKLPGGPPGPGEYIKWNLYDGSMVKQGATITTNKNLINNYGLTAAAAGSFDFGAARVEVAWKNIFDNSGPTISSLDSSGTEQANEEFSPASAAAGLTYGDALGDGARFWSMATGPSSANLTKHSTWTWTSASSIYWVCYTWYDSAGTVHETQVGPRSSITMGRRKQLVITTLTIPGAGGADDPNNIRYYMAPNASDPGATNFKLQATQTGTTYTATTYASGGAADPASNNYPAGTAAQIQSQTGAILLKGDGTARIQTNIDLPAGVLGYATVSANQGSITTEVDLTSLSVTVTVGTGRRIRISCVVPFVDTVATDFVQLSINEDGSNVRTHFVIHTSYALDASATTSAIRTPSGGSHTYKLRMARASGTGTVTMSATGTRPAYILVEDIGT